MCDKNAILVVGIIHILRKAFKIIIIDRRGEIVFFSKNSHVCFCIRFVGVGPIFKIIELRDK